MSHEEQPHDSSANPLGPLLAVEADAVAIERALRRAKQAVAAVELPVELPHLTTSKPAPIARPASPSVGRLTAAWRVRLAAGLAAAIAVVALWSLSPRASVARDLAAMQERVAQTRTVEFDLTWAGEGGEKGRVRVHESGIIREDLPDGCYIVSDLKHGRQLSVWPSDRTAELTQGRALRHENFYEQIRRIPREAAEVVHTSEEIHGRPALCYRIVRPKVHRADDEFPWTSGTLLIWVDRVTRLPLRIECHHEDDLAEVMGDEPGAIAAPSDDLDESESVTVLDNIRFDSSFDKALFTFRAPPEYQLTITGAEKLLPLPADPQRAAPELKPLCGLGAVRFGMTTAEVEALLGQADLSEWGLEYFSRGYSFDFEDDKVCEIRCYAQPASEWVVRDFAGSTTEGVRLGDTRDSVERIYGPADTVSVFEGETTLYYDERGLELTLMQGKVVEMLATSDAETSPDED